MRRSSPSRPGRPPQAVGRARRDQAAEPSGCGRVCGRRGRGRCLTWLAIFRSGPKVRAAPQSGLDGLDQRNPTPVVLGPRPARKARSAEPRTRVGVAPNPGLDGLDEPGSRVDPLVSTELDRRTAHAGPDRAPARSTDWPERGPIVVPFTRSAPDSPAWGLRHRSGRPGACGTRIRARSSGIQPPVGLRSRQRARAPCIEARIQGQSTTIVRVGERGRLTGRQYPTNVHVQRRRGAVDVVTPRATGRPSSGQDRAHPDVWSRRARPAWSCRFRLSAPTPSSWVRAQPHPSSWVRAQRGRRNAPSPGPICQADHALNPHPSSNQARRSAAFALRANPGRRQAAGRAQSRPAAEFPDVRLARRSRMRPSSPLTNEGDSSVDSARASSTAWSMTTAPGTSGSQSSS